MQGKSLSQISMSTKLINFAHHNVAYLNEYNGWKDNENGSNSDEYCDYPNEIKM
jgi:hypothetical protein